MASGQFQVRKNALAETRRVILARFNTLRAVATEVERIYNPDAIRGGVLHDLHASREAYSVKAVQDVLFVAQSRCSRHAHPLQIVMEE